MENPEAGVTRTIERGTPRFSFLRTQTGKGAAHKKGYGISGTAFGTERGRGCTSVDASVRNACPWGAAISISPLPLASPSRITSSTSVRSVAYQ